MMRTRLVFMLLTTLYHQVMRISVSPSGRFERDSKAKTGVHRAAAKVAHHGAQSGVTL